MLVFVLAASASEIAPEAYEWRAESGWPMLDPTGARIAWVAGVPPATEADLCVAGIRTPFDCVPYGRVPTGAVVLWVDASTLLVTTADQWTTCTEAGCAPSVPIPRGTRIGRTNGRILFVERDGDRWTTTTSLADGTDRRDEGRGVLPGALLFATASAVPLGSWDERKSGFATTYHLGADGRARPTFRVRASREEAGGERWYPASFRPDRGRLLAIDGQDHDRDALVRVDLVTGRSTVLYEAEHGGVVEVFQHPEDGRPLAVAVRFTRRTWQALDPSLEADLAWLEAHVDGDWSILRATPDLAVWLLWTWSGTVRARALVFDRRDHSLIRVPPRFGASEDVAWRPMETPEVTATDGLRIPVYLTRPDPERYGPGPYPTVVYVHGGPWRGGFRYGYLDWFQELADNGLASLAVDFRGSAGYGAAFREASRHEIGRQMQQDLYDAIDALVALGAVDPARVAWFGESYGGYAVLHAATTGSRQMTCGVSAAGPPRFGWFRLGKRITRDLLPATHPEDVATPLFLANGTRDRQVRIGPVRRFANRAVAAGAALTMVELPGEGHEVHGEASDAVTALSEAFMADCLGVPWEVPTLPEALRLRVRHDVAGVPGL